MSWLEDSSWTKENARKGGKATFGTQKGTARLTEADVREIRHSALSSAEMALKVGVSATQIRRIRRREHWQHID